MVRKGRKEDVRQAIAIQIRDLGTHARQSLAFTTVSARISRVFAAGRGWIRPSFEAAWTFEPRPPEYGQSVLREVGWDGRTPVLVVCPINPFEWPVKASIGKLALHKMVGAYKKTHYRGPYFHNSGPAAERAYEHYLSSIANAVGAFRKKRNVFVILVATERLDARPANRISEQLGGIPVLTSDQYNMYELVSILRSCHMMASSRYHGIVTSMPCGWTPEFTMVAHSKAWPCAADSCVEVLPDRPRATATDAAPTTPSRLVTRRSSATTLAGLSDVSNIEWHRIASNAAS